MAAHLPGTEKHYRDIDPGTWFFANVEGDSCLCLLVNAPQAGQFVLIINAPAAQGQDYPVLYDGNLFMNDRVLAINDPIVNPMISSQLIGFGIPHGGRQTRALFLQDEILYIHAAHSHQVSVIAVLQGRIISKNLDRAVRFDRWSVDIRNADGLHQPIETFLA